MRLARLVRLGFVASLVSLASCIGGSQAFVVSPSGRATLANAKGTFCEHCAGKEMWSVVFEDARAPSGVVVLTFDACSAGPLRIDTSGTEVTVRPREGAPVDCRSGTVDIATCSKTHLRLAFDVRCDDGGHVEGRFDGPLELDRGYD